MDPLLDDLNEPQRAAVLHQNGPLMVLAGAGSGKTRVITRRIARLLRDGVPPWRVLAVTFTNKAAGEMAKRVEEMARVIGVGSTDVRVATFHSMCARLLRRYGHELGYPRDFSIYDTYDRDSAIKMLMEERGMDLRRVRPAQVGRRISTLKNHGTRPKDLVVGFSDVDEVVQQIFRPYHDLLRHQGAMDFDDLLLVFEELLDECPGVREILQDRTEHLLIDEFQDTNRVQYGISKKLVGRHRNLCVVGDPDQSIYKFRGAELRNVLDFENDYPDAEIVRLEQNYRSVGNVLAAAEAVIDNNQLRKPKKLWTDAEDGELLRHECHDSPRGEAGSVAARARMLIDDGVDADQIAVFYRSHFLSRSLEEGFIEYGIPYRIVGGLSFFERREIKDLLAFLRVLVNPLDDLSMERIVNVPPRRVGKATVKKLRDLAAVDGMSLLEAVLDPDVRGQLGNQARKGLTELAEVLEKARTASTESAAAALDVILEGLAYRDYVGGLGDPEDQARLENVDELFDDAVTFDDRRRAGAGQPALLDDGQDGDDNAQGLAAYLQHVALLTSDDRAGGETGGAVSMMTVHAAKGLEFEHVFLAGLEDGLFPHQRSIDGGDAELEEERRLMYVALTRARERLYLSSCMVRTVQGEMRDQEVSRFLGEIPEELFDEDGGTSAGDWLDRSTQWPFGGGGRVRESADPFAQPAASEAEYAAAFDPVDYAGIDPAELAEQALAEGVRVAHPHYGEGVVRRLAGAGARAKVTVDFDDAGERLLIVEHAGLRILPHRTDTW